VRLAVLKAGGDLTSPPADRKAAADIAASFQHVAIRHLEQRLKRAVALCRDDPALSEVAPAPPTPPPPPPRTEWTRRVPHPVLIGHASFLGGAGGAGAPSCRARPHASAPRGEARAPGA
jgi:tRNA A37 threonylcarbamoyltransferase TsaD